MSALLEADALSKTYRTAFRRRDVKALDSFSLSVDTGEIFGLLGPNGAGKTTFVKIVLGLVKPTSGSASIDGTTVSDWRSRRQVGYLPENHRFPDYLTARQMLRHYGRLSAGQSSNRDIDRLLDRVGMLRWADTPIRKFSKGMMQRTGIAHALANNPKLIFLDEPTDGVDPVGRREIRELLTSLRHEGKTIFLNSHILSELELVCSRIAILNRGKLVTEGRLDELLQKQTVYAVTSTRIPEQLLDRLSDVQPAPVRASGRGERPDSELSHYEIHVSSRAHLNVVLDQLRREHVEIESIIRNTDSLEELFVRAVDSDGSSQEGIAR
ncbi:MAG: ABC transporter ATP-binding protein [Bacteroidetes bacterium]|nr:ABC transporter ATP-binding protein [Bacteroidota bacterium]